jgi:hypothetical protein
MRPTLALIDRTTQAARGIEIKTSDAGAKAQEGLRSVARPERISLAGSTAPRKKDQEKQP